MQTSTDKEQIIDTIHSHPSPAVPTTAIANTLGRDTDDADAAKELEVELAALLSQGRIMCGPTQSGTIVWWIRD